MKTSGSARNKNIEPAHTWQGAFTLAPIAASRFLSLFSVGFGFVVLAWLGALKGSMQLVGQLFLASSLTTILVSVFAGALADRRSRLALIRSAWMVRLAGICLLMLGTVENRALLFSLFAYSITTAISGALGAGAMDAAFQNAVPASRRVDLSVKLEILRQLGLVCGMGLSGFLLNAYHAFASVSLLLVTLALQVGLFETWLSRYANGSCRNGQGIWLFWFEGVRSACRNRHVAVSMLAASLLFSIAQLTNLLTPVFVKETLERGSDLYGMLESVWSAGGAALLVLVSLKSAAASRERVEFLLLIAIGLLMIVFAATRNIPSLVVLYAILGGLFSLTRALCDGRLLALVSTDEIGRVRSASVILSSFTGMVIFLAPTIFRNEDVVLYYCIWGGLVALIGLVATFAGGRSKEKTIFL